MKFSYRNIRIVFLVVWALASAVLCWKIQTDVEGCATCLPAGMNLTSKLFEPRLRWVPAPNDPGVTVQTKLY